MKLLRRKDPLAPRTPLVAIWILYVRACGIAGLRRSLDSYLRYSLCFRRDGAQDVQQLAFFLERALLSTSALLRIHVGLLVDALERAGERIRQ
jgi:hypothetical protein